MSTVEDYMVTDLVSVSPADDIVSAMRVLLEKHLSGAPVLAEDGQLVGILSQKDCLPIIYNSAYHQDWGGRVEQHMSRNVESLEADTSIVDAAGLFLSSSFRRFPVLRAGRLVGLISRHDILRAIDDLYLREAR